MSVSRLEQIYAAGSGAIHQIYIYGNSLRAHLVAVVVPALGAHPARLPRLSALAYCMQGLCLPDKGGSLLESLDLLMRSSTSCALHFVEHHN